MTPMPSEPDKVRVESDGEQKVSVSSFEVPESVIERVKQIANSTTPIGDREVKDLALAWLELYRALNEGSEEATRAFERMLTESTTQCDDERPVQQDDSD